MNRRFDTTPAPHVGTRNSVRRIMLLVMAALLPVTLAQAWFFGVGVLFQVLVACAFALAIELASLRLRSQPLARFATDGSALVTGWLFALCIPPLSPWWVAAIAMLAAIGCAKHLYGGLGYNLFNPAMVGYAVAVICFPRELSQWPAPDLAPGAFDALRAIGSGIAPGGDFDAITRATPLDDVRRLVRTGETLGEIRADAGFQLQRRAWSWIAACAALGGIALCLLRAADWRTPLTVVTGVVLVATPFWLADPDLALSPLQHLTTGGLMLAAFFIATDPVTGCTTPRGRWLFGLGMAALTLAIRRWGAYPDGIAFAILLMNGAAPLIDRLTPPRIFGR